MSVFTEKLRTARAHLAAWRPRIEAVLRSAGRVSGSGAPIAAQTQSLRDRFEKLEIALLKQARLENAWRQVRMDVQRSWLELEEAYASLAASVHHAGETRRGRTGGSDVPDR